MSSHWETRSFWLDDGKGVSGDFLFPLSYAVLNAEKSQLWFTFHGDSRGLDEGLWCAISLSASREPILQTLS